MPFRPFRLNSFKLGNPLYPPTSKSLHAYKAPPPKGKKKKEKQKENQACNEAHNTMTDLFKVRKYLKYRKKARNREILDERKMPDLPGKNYSKLTT